MISTRFFFNSFFFLLRCRALLLSCDGGYRVIRSKPHVQSSPWCSTLFWPFRRDWSSNRSNLVQRMRRNTARNNVQVWTDCPDFDRAAQPKTSGRREPTGWNYFCFLFIFFRKGVQNCWSVKRTFVTTHSQGLALGVACSTRATNCCQPKITLTCACVNVCMYVRVCVRMCLSESKTSVTIRIGTSGPCCSIGFVCPLSTKYLFFFF